ncbi:hypothetical protein V500_07808 [Pseudogymnoascus sp. VKM F-4518 (FW-2643)]|nr:hypothetical protein V500_07808 [Pseudogymnoascus sp. VKM F-4518 (FW-2643)]
MTRASRPAVREPPQQVNLLPLSSPAYYSLAVTLNKKGETIASYRKQSLYYTDDTWALGGPDEFYNSLVTLYTCAALVIHSGEVKPYGVIGRGQRELLMVDTSKRPQAKLVSDPSQHELEGQLGRWVEGPVYSVNTGNKSCDSHESKGIQRSYVPLIEPEDIRPRIDEIIAGGISMSSRTSLRTRSLRLQPNEARR